MPMCTIVCVCVLLLEGERSVYVHYLVCMLRLHARGYLRTIALLFFTAYIYVFVATLGTQVQLS